MSRIIKSLGCSVAVLLSLGMGVAESAPYKVAGKSHQSGKVYSNKPVVAKNSAGQYVDKRNGNPLSEAEVADATKTDQWNSAPEGMVYATWETEERAAGLDKGPFKDGRLQVAGSADGPNSLTVDVARTELSAGAQLNSNSASVHAGVKIVALAVEAKTSTAFGDKDGLNNAEATMSGRASVGAEASVEASAGVDEHGVRAQVGAGASIGGRLEGEISGSTTICGIKIKNTTSGFVSYGAGVEASGHFGFDWAEMKLKFGGRASATAGLGAGVGSNVEISLEKLLEDPRVAATCMREGLAKGTERFIEGNKLAAEKLAEGGRKIWSVLKPLGMKIGESAVAFAEANRRNANNLAEAAQQFGNNAGRYASTAFGGRDTPTQVRTSEDRPVRMVVPRADPIRGPDGEGIGGASSWVRP